MPVTYEVLEGVVQGGNDGGFKVLERWCNYDQQYAGHRPKPGDRVKLRVRNGKYIIALVGADQELPPEPPQRRAGGAFRSPEEERRIVRQAVLKAAIEWGGHTEPRPTTAEVIKLAERFEQWVYR